MKNLVTTLCKKLKPTESILHKTLLSHISILILSIIMCSFYYIHTYTALKQSSASNQRLSLENAKEQLDYVFYDSITLSNTLMLNRYVRSLSHSQSFLTKNPVLERHYLSEELHAFTSSNLLIENIILYFPASGYIVTSASSHPAYLLDSMENRMFGCEKLDTLCKTLSTDSFLCFSSESGDELLLAHPLITSRNGNVLSLSILQIGKKTLERRLQNNLPYESESVLAFIDRDSLLLSTETDVTLDNIPSIWEYFRNHEGSSLKIRLKPSNAVYIIDHYPTLIANTGLISITRQDIYNTALYRLLFVLGTTLSICLLTGIVFIYYYSRWSYRPIEQILHFMGKEARDVTDTDEYRLILNMLSKNRSEIERQRILLKNEYLHKILTGELPFAQITSRIISEFSLLFPSSRSCVVSLRMREEDGAQYDQLLCFVVQNVMGELLTPSFPSYFFCTDADRTTIIINVPEIYQTDYDNVVKEITKILHSFLVFLKTHYNCSFLAGISRILPNSSLPAAYIQAESASEYLCLFLQGQIMPFDQIPAARKPLTIRLNTQDHVLGLLLGGSRDNLDAYFKAIYQDIACGVLSETDSKSCFYFFYLTTAQIRHYCQEHYKFTPDTLDFIGKDYFSLSLLDALRLTQTKYTSFLEELSLQKEKRPENKWGADICRYIENNYFDTNLNLNTIAEYFSITPSYLSRKFKDRYDRSINDYLYEVRISHARQLICDSSLKVGEIAQITGFTDSNAFIRIFKKYTGITPGKYKDRP